MATPPTPQHLIDEALAALEQFGGNKSLAADKLGIPRNTLRNRIAAAKRGMTETQKYMTGVNKEPLRLYDPEAAYQVPRGETYDRRRYEQPRPAFILEPAKAPRGLDHDVTDVEHILVIPDRHRDPRYPHRIECDTWIAKEGASRRPKYVVDLGDHMTFDSVSRHDKNHQARGRLKPTIKQDLDHMIESHAAFRAGMGDWKPILKKAQGNHEARLWSFENENPESLDSHTFQYKQILTQFGWREYSFGEIFYIGGCGFVHCPINGMGKALGGKTASHRAASLLCTSLFSGHTHKFNVYTDAKLDPRGGVTVVECGCALPFGEIEDYATISPNGWAWGIVFAKVSNGLVLDLEFVSMKTLKDKWS